VTIEVVVIVRFNDSELLFTLLVHAEDELVEDVEVSLLRVLSDHSRFFKKKV
jgi:hypothetical protein